ncbi:MAG: phenylalanine--tRNA ligase subunit alpha [Deltaproteobacteria bacterium]|nr:phenylalanine--tRNA ligase subunit alpha [Deltaproteobacteria bacterium]MBW2360437.1 phenylalanine--tRNA ligase subunit alpha [Deltaproteobacteria bacterium]
MAPEGHSVDQLLGQARTELSAASSTQELAEVRAGYLGKKGSISQLLRTLGKLDPAERKQRGQAVNDAKQAIEAHFAECRAALEGSARQRALAETQLDVTLPGAAPRRGHLHPLTHVTRDMVSFFTSMGFSVEEGPEVETDWHNFEALNIPAEHPSRDEQDTFYVSGGNLLRTQTSNVQIRAMTGRTPPFRFIAPGRVYRHDLSPKHSPMFHQIEGFLVDDRVTFGDLKGVLFAFAKHLFGEETELRFRANHFPFTEPSAEMDLTWKGEWLEWGGCGMIHPQVLERCGIDPETWRGFAFGMGIDRTALLRYGFPALRLLFEGDVRVLEQI